MFISLLTLSSVVISSLNICWWHSPIIGVIGGLFFIGLSSILWGKKIFKEKTLGEQIYLGFLFFLALVIVFLTIIYYVYEINDLVIIFFVLLMSIILSILNWQKVSIGVLRIKNYELWKIKKADIFWLIFYLLLLVISFFILKSGATMEAVRTPWIFVSKIFFVVYFLATAILIYLNFKLKTAANLILNSLHLFFSFSIANIIFPIGFGYDPFIHQATEKYILNFGYILPKNFYYLGQYNLVVFLTRIFQWPIGLIDKNLVPFLASLLLPASFYYAFKKSFFIFLFLLIPFSVFTFTTPQNLADLLLTVLIFISFNFSFYQLPITNYQLPVILSLAILFIHPMAGVAAVIFLLLLVAKNKIKKWFYFLISASLCFTYVLVFFIFSKSSNINKIEFVNNFNLKDFYHNLFRFIPDLYLNTNIVHFFKTIIYFFWQPIVLFVIILGLAVGGYFKIKKDYELLASPTDRRITDYGLLFIILLVNSWLLFSIIDFPFLINYERGDFSSRIFNIAVYFLIPLALWALGYLIEKINLRIKKYLLIIFLAATLTCSLYFSYPRQDEYMLNRGFNTSIHDFRAIKYLEENTLKPYAVLANQQIGAAALTEFGFRYFDNKYFFYSIPTGGELYQIYAKMAYDEEISYAVAKEAMDLVQVDVLYLYLPDYWFNLKKIKPQLEEVADETLNLENGKVWVFKFIRKKLN